MDEESLKVGGTRPSSLHSIIMSLEAPVLNKNEEHADLFCFETNYDLATASTISFVQNNLRYSLHFNSGTIEIKRHIIWMSV